MQIHKETIVKAAPTGESRSHSKEVLPQYCSKCLVIIFLMHQCESLGTWKGRVKGSINLPSCFLHLQGTYKKFGVLLFWTTVIATFTPKTANEGTDRKVDRLADLNACSQKLFLTFLIKKELYHSSVTSVCIQKMTPDSLLLFLACSEGTRTAHLTNHVDSG